MKYSQQDLGITTKREFNTLVDRLQNGTPAGPGWGEYDVECRFCGRKQVYTAPIGTRGLHCNYCGKDDWNWVWGTGRGHGDGSILCPVGYQYARISRN